MNRQQIKLLQTIRAKTWRYRPLPVHWPELHGVAKVLDFGGAFGVHFREAIADPKVDRGLRWAVVERPELVNMARGDENSRLRFFSEIAEAVVWLGIPELVHSNGALQYSPRPYADLAALIGLGARLMQWRRLSFSPHFAATLSDVEVSRRIHHGPGQAALWQRLFDWRMVSQPRTLLSRKTFLGAHQGYRLLRSEAADTGDYLFQRKDIR